jgi:hypothetical protein
MVDFHRYNPSLDAGKSIGIYEVHGTMLMSLNVFQGHYSLLSVSVSGDKV